MVAFLALTGAPGVTISYQEKSLNVGTNVKISKKKLYFFISKHL